jgi:hypothetical protein
MDWSEKTAKLTDAEFPDAGPSISLIHARILIALDPLKPQSQVDQDIVGILSNANTTTKTAYELWRRGLLLQTGTLLRSAVEASAFAVLLHDRPAVHGRYRANQFSSSKAVSQATKILGSVGQEHARLWGELSKHFVHVGPFQRRLSTWHIDIRGNKLPLQIVLLDLKWTYYLLDVCTEFCLYDSITDARYWQKTGRDLVFQPTGEAEKWITDFMEKDVTAIQKAVQVASP